MNFRMFPKSEGVHFTSTGEKIRNIWLKNPILKVSSEPRGLIN